MDRQKQSRNERGPELSSLQFAQLAQRLVAVARSCDLVAPAFRSPPRQPGLRRSVQRRPNGSVTVAVAVRSRPAPVVAADMIDGLIHINQDRLAPNQLAAIRDELWIAATEVLSEVEDDDIDRTSRRWVA